MTNLESAISHATDLFEGSPWLRHTENVDNPVPGCKDLTWGELGHLLDAARVIVCHRAALKQIDVLAIAHRKGAIGEAQKIARAALKG